MDDILHTRDIITDKNGLVVHSSQVTSINILKKSYFTKKIYRFKLHFTDQVKDMVEGRDRRPELGYFQAMRLRQMPQNGGIRDDKSSPDDNASPRDSVIFLT